MAMQPLALEAGSGDGSSHSSSRARFRAALGLVLAAVALAVTGDRSRAATVPAAVFGQDPLEVLELKVRPNVIVVLDSSGSMTEIVENDNNTTASGDHPRSRLAQAKRVMRQVVQNNQNKVSFQMGTYTQNSVTLRHLAAGNHRFQYVTNGATFPFMDVAGTELTVQGADGDTMGRGLQSWQIIYPQWNTLYFEEDAATDAVCTAVLPGPFPKFYARGGPAATAGTLAADLQNAMNAATCTGSARANVYSVTYDPATGRFGFLRSTASRPFRIRWDRTPNNIRNSLAETSTAVPGFSTGTISTDAPWILLYRTTGAGGSGVGLGAPADWKWTFTETIAGTATRFYNMRAGRLWNGEVIRVTPTGGVCGMDFATAATKTNPASIRVVATDATCNPTGNVATFEWGGGDYSGASGSCNGFRSKSQIVPCDLPPPPTQPTQVAMISPYLEDELPLDAGGDPADWNGDGTRDYIESQDGGWSVDDDQRGSVREG